MKFDDPNLTPEEERLSAYLDGELSVDERQRVEQLLQENARFRKVLEEFKLLRGHLRELPSHVAPEWLTDAILERIGQLNGPATNGSDAPVIPSGANEPAPISHRTKWRGVMLAGMALAASLLVMLFVVSDSDSVVSQNSGDDRSTPSTASQSPADRAVTADALGSRQLVSSADEERQPELELANQPEEARSELSEFESLVESPRPGRPPEMQSAPFQSAAIESAEESRESASVPRAQSVELLSEADRVATKENQLLGAARQLPAPQAALPAIEFTESSPETGAISGFSNELQRVADRHQADVVVLIAGTIDSSFNNAQLYRVDRAHSFARGPTAREGASLTAPPDADRASSQQAEQPVDTRYRMQARRLNSEADDIAATPTEFDGAYRVMRVEHTNESLRQALAALTERSADRQQVDVFVASSDMSPSSRLCRRLRRPRKRRNNLTIQGRMTAPDRCQHVPSGKSRRGEETPQRPPEQMARNHSPNPSRRNS
jgi:anti-sigma factor RsiW